MRLRMKHGIEVIIVQGKNYKISFYFVFILYLFYFIFIIKDADFYLITLQVCKFQSDDNKDEKKN